MLNKWIKLSGVALMSLYLAACDTAEDEGIEDNTTDMAEEEGTEEETGDEAALEEDSDEDTEADDTADLDEEAEDDHDNHDEADADVAELITIEGVADHYHTGALVELTAVMSEETDYDDWHWYSREDDADEWEIISGQHTQDLIMEAPETTVNVRAVLYDDAHAPYAQSEAVELEVDNH